jgi:hypothetical protein
MFPIVVRILASFFCNLTHSAFERTSLPLLDALTHTTSADRFCVTVIQISDVKWQVMSESVRHYHPLFSKAILHLLCSKPSISDYNLPKCLWHFHATK